MIAPVAVALAVPLVSEAWHRREYLLSFLPASLVPLGICGGWLAAAESRAPGLALAWWQANAIRFAVPPVEALGYWAQTLLWATWPAWPLALWTLWEARRRTFEPGMRMLIAACAASFAVLLALGAPREVYGLPLLLPLALLAGAGVPGTWAFGQSRTIQDRVCPDEPVRDGRPGAQAAVAPHVAITHPSDHPGSL